MKDITELTNSLINTDASEITSEDVAMFLTHLGKRDLAGAFRDHWGRWPKPEQVVPALQEYSDSYGWHTPYQIAINRIVEAVFLNDKHS